MTREEALAICFANLKGSRDKDLLATARALHYLRSLPEYGSNARVGEAVGVSGEIVREFLALLRLPQAIQRLLDQRQLSLDQGRRLWQLGRKRPDLLQDAADTMIDLNVIDARHLVDYVLKHPDASVAEAKQRVLESKTVKEKEYHVVAIVSEEEYRELQKGSRRRLVSVNDLVGTIVRQWLNQDGNHA